METPNDGAPTPQVQPDVMTVVGQLKDAIARNDAQTFIKLFFAYSRALDTPDITWEEEHRYDYKFASAINEEIARLRNDQKDNETADFLVKLCRKFGLAANKKNTYLLDVEAVASHDRGPTYDR